MATHAQTPLTAPPGWYPDGSGYMQRYWDGNGWTEHFAPVAGYGHDEGPVATTGDWVAGVILSILMPIVGVIAGIVYVAKGGERAKCGWMCIGISLAWTAFAYLTFLSGGDPQQSDPYRY